MTKLHKPGKKHLLDGGKPPRGSISADHPMFALINEAYHVFAGATPSDVEVCTNCCMDRRIERDFFNPPIRQMPLEYLRSWFGAACSTDGVSHELAAYLIPRVLEVIASGEEPATIALEVTLDRFRLDDRSRWGARKWELLDRLRRALLRYKISFGEERLDQVLCMFSRGGWPLTDLLGEVRAVPDELLVTRLWKDWCSHGLPSIEQTLFWQGNDGQAAFSFYTSPDMYARLEALALNDAVAPQLAQRASEVADVIRAA